MTKRAGNGNQPIRLKLWLQSANEKKQPGFHRVTVGCTPDTKLCSKVTLITFSASLQQTTRFYCLRVLVAVVPVLLSPHKIIVLVKKQQPRPYFPWFIYRTINDGFFTCWTDRKYKMCLSFDPFIMNIVLVQTEWIVTGCAAWFPTRLFVTIKTDFGVKHQFVIAIRDHANLILFMNFTASIVHRQCLKAEKEEREEEDEEIITINRF